MAVIWMDLIWRDRPSGLCPFDKIGEVRDQIDGPFDAAIAQRTVTYDFARLMKQEGHNPTEVKCSEFADAMIRNL